MGIRQLASELNLSIGTVSRALNDRPDVNADTRARVKAAAARLGYVPDQSGRSLRSGRTGIVAAIIPSRGADANTDSGLLAVLEGARRTLRGRDLDLIVLFRGPDEDPLANLKRFTQRRIADAVIVSATCPNDPRLAYMQAAGIDFVALGRSLGLDDFPAVDFDFESIAAECASVFVRDGHRRLGLACTANTLNYEEILYQSMASAAADCGLGPDAVALVPMSDGRLAAEGRRALTGPSPVTAVLASHESIAGALYAELAALGLQVGRDVSVVCTFPVIDYRTLTPTLSHFDADLDEVGVALAESLLATLPDRPVTAGSPRGLVRFPSRFVACASHGPAGARLVRG